MRVAIALAGEAFAARLKQMVASVGAHEVVWCEADVERALSLCREDLPDVLLVDLVDARTSAAGMDFLRRLALGGPCGVLALMPTAEEDTWRVFEATGAGALDVVPVVVADGERRVDAAVLKLRLRNIGWLMRRAVPTQVEVAQEDVALVAIGASAGGPPALATLFNQLPRDFPAAVVLVQHVSGAFSARMADWFASSCDLPVRLARQGERVKRGTVLMAGGEAHLKLGQDGRLEYCEGPAEVVYRPSIDLFFDSVVRHWRGKAVGVLLTGMGRDGAEGLARMRAKGFVTIAQDRDSSAVFGMPKAAAAINAAVEVLPLESIGKRIVELVG